MAILQWESDKKKQIKLYIKGFIGAAGGVLFIFCLFFLKTSMMIFFCGGGGVGEDWEFFCGWGGGVKGG